MLPPEDQGFCIRGLGLRERKVHTTIQKLSVSARSKMLLQYVPTKS